MSAKMILKFVKIRAQVLMLIN